MKYNLADPVKVKDLEVGTQVVYSADMCKIVRIDKPKGLANRRIIEFRGHPRLKDFTTVMHKNDILYRQIKKDD